MSVSRRAGPPQRGHVVVDPVLGRGQRRAPAGRVVLDVGQQDRQVFLGDRHDPVALAVHHRDRAAPVPLARDEPVAQAVVDRGVPLALAVQPGHDPLQRVAVGQPVEVRGGVHQCPVTGVGQAVVGPFDDPPDRQVEPLGECEVALVVRRHGHDRPGAVLHQHVVGDVHWDALAVDGVDHVPAQEDAGLLLVGRAPLLGGLHQRVVDVAPDLVLASRAVRQPVEVGVLRREDEERRAEQRVGACGEDRIVDPQLLAAECHLGALGAADPVALHRLDVLGPLDRVEVVEQAVGVVGDPELPLLELLGLDLRAAALATTVDHLLVGQNGLVVRAPLDRGLLAVGQAVLVELQEDPLRPAVVPRLVGAELARPVDRDAPFAELALERGDRLVGRVARMLAAGDRVVLGREPEGVVAHRVQHAPASAAMEVRDRVADRVDLEVPDVRLAAGVGQHLEHVRVRSVAAAVGARRGVRYLPRALVGPHALPAGLDLLRVVAILGHRGRPRIESGRQVAPAGARRGRLDTMARERGAIAQLGERLHGMQEVVGSSPTSSTSRSPRVHGGFVVQAA